MRTKSANMTAIARRCGVSAMTVSRALSPRHCVNEATRRRILEAAAQAGYQPDGRMGRPRGQGKNTRKPVRIIFDANSGGANLYHACLLGAIERTLARHERDCLLRTYDGSYDNFVWLCDLLRSEISLPTMIVGCFPLDKLRTLLQLAHGALLVDYTENPSLAFPYNSAGFDNIEAARIAVRHLLEIGRRRILLMKGRSDHAFSMDIENGYCNALELAGIDFDKRLVASADFTAAGAYKRAMDIIDHGLKFDAVFTNDEMALGVMRALSEKGKCIPDDAAIVGCDGLSFGKYTTPSLTTVVLDYAELGKTAAEHLLMRSEDKRPPMRIRLMPTLEIRESTTGTAGNKKQHHGVIMKKKLINHALSAILILFCGTLFPPSQDYGAASAADRYVSPPGGYGTNDTTGGYTNWLGAATNIQWAVNAAAAGETIWVTNGTYYLTNQISVGNIILRSVNGHEMTIINGNYPAYTNRCLYIDNTGAVVTGFTVMNAFYTNIVSGISGGGVYLSGGTMRNCHITTNVGGSGGGIHMGGGNIYDCIISSNLCVTNGARTGGGIYITGANCIISNCIFRGNVAGYRGGGIYIYGASATDNRANTIINCTFISNSTVGPGAYNLGGAVVISGANNIIRNCIFIGNSGFNGDMGQVSGLIEMTAGNTKIQNCTFVRNSGNGLYRFSSDGGLVENCIITSNTYTPNSLTTNKNNRTDSTIATGVNFNNITNNPLFVNYAADNYRLSKNSPCINSGTNEDWMSGAVDLEGRMRIRYGTVDMGAYECVHEATVYRFY